MGKHKGRTKRRKVEEKKIKNSFKLNKLFLYVFLNSFYSFPIII